MLQIKRTNSTDADFIELVKLLDADLAKRDGEEHAFYAQFNTIDALQYAVVAYKDGVPLGCGAIKLFEEGAMEVKRMYVLPNSRRMGAAAQVLAALEEWATELNCHKCVLETGKKQPEAIQLYLKCGYEITDNYGQYIGVENSVCFEKVLG